MNLRMLRPLLSIAALLFVLAISAGNAAEMTLDEVLAANYDARGGEDKLRAVDTLVMIGTMNVGGVDAPFTITMKRPGKMRMEFSVQDMTAIQAYDGEKAWMVMPFSGSSEPVEMPADQVENVKEMGDIDGPLMDWKEKGYQIELVGLEEVDDAEAYKLELTLQNGDVRYQYLDGTSFLTIKQEGKTEMQGMEVDFETTLSDYRKVDGLMFAHSIESRAKGAPAGQVITIEEIKVNPEISDDIFVMPEKEGGVEQGE